MMVAVVRGDDEAAGWEGGMVWLAKRARVYPLVYTIITYKFHIFI